MYQHARSQAECFIQSRYVAGRGQNDAETGSIYTLLRDIITFVGTPDDGLYNVLDRGLRHCNNEVSI